MIGQTYQAKRWGAAGAVALAATSMPMPSCVTTGTRSFRNDHGIEWPLGTGDHPTG